jgi:hypothetical protein
MTKVEFGPFASIDTKGVKLPLAAICIEVRLRDQLDFGTCAQIRSPRQIFERSL